MPVIRNSASGTACIAMCACIGCGGPPNSEEQFEHFVRRAIHELKTNEDFNTNWREMETTESFEKVVAGSTPDVGWIKIIAVRRSTRLAFQKKLDDILAHRMGPHDIQHLLETDEGTRNFTFHYEFIDGKWKLDRTELDSAPPNQVQYWRIEREKVPQVLLKIFTP